MTMIYHITSRSAALLAQQSGEYRPDSLASDGFIHFSQIFQVLGVANAFYAGQKELVILVVEPTRLKAQLKFEAPVHPGGSAPGTATSTQNNFPHLYGPLNFEAVEQVIDFPAGPDGKFELPDLIAKRRS